MTEESAAPLTLSDPAVIACPYPAYARLQREHPVYRDPVTGYFEVTRYDDIRAVAMDPVIFSNKFNRQNSRSAELQAEMQRLYDEAGHPPTPTLLNNDPPGQRAIRSLVDKAFLPARMSALQPAILAEVTQLLDAMLARGHAEFMSDFAIALPVNIIADQLGVARAQRSVIKLGSDALIAVADPLTPDDDMLELTRRVIAMQRLLSDRIEHSRRSPDETILSLVANDSEQPFDVPLLVHLFQSILVAGNETTTNALGNALLMLIDDRPLFRRLKSDPALVRGFVEESLRAKAPFQGFFRLVTRDTELHGVEIKAGSIMVLRWGAAGHDERYFQCPSEVQLGRPNISKHMTFGAGTHFCLGNLLARTEMRIAFEQIVSRVNILRLADGPSARVLAHSFFNQGVSRLELRFDPSE